MTDKREEPKNSGCATSHHGQAKIGELSEILAAFRQLLTQSTAGTDTLRLQLGELGVAILDAIKGSPVIPVPQHIVDTVSVSNRTVSFVLDGTTHFGTGVLVGPAHVLTAAHLFFDEKGVLLDRNRLKRISVEARTTLIGRIVVEGARRTAALDPRGDEWLVDPRLRNDVAQRDVNGLDFAIVKLDQRIGDDPIGNGQTRKWFEIPTASTAQILSPNLVIRVFQFLDRGALLTSGGLVRDVTEDRLRVLHTASTADSASGAVIVDDQFHLVALHLSGPASAEFPIANRGLPIRRVAEVIDQSIQGSPTVRSMLK